MEMEVQGRRVRGREAQVALEGLTEGEDLWRRERERGGPFGYSSPISVFRP